MFKRLLELFRGNSDRVASVEEGVSGKIDWQKRADRSDARAKALNIDPPRPGRKTYSERYTETSSMSTGDIKAKIAEREARGEECGVLYRVLADKGE